jgi:hypothetical protein
MLEKQEAEKAHAKEQKKKKKLQKLEEEKSAVKSQKDVLSSEKEQRDKKIQEKITSICTEIEKSILPKKRQLFSDEEDFLGENEDTI